MVRTNSRNNEEAALVRKGGRVPGSKQYHKPTWYDLVAKYDLISIFMWDVVANQYRSIDLQLNPVTSRKEPSCAFSYMLFLVIGQEEGWLNE